MLAFLVLRDLHVDAIRVNDAAASSPYLFIITGLLESRALVVRVSGRKTWSAVYGRSRMYGDIQRGEIRRQLG